MVVQDGPLYIWSPSFAGGLTTAGSQVTFQGLEDFHVFLQASKAAMFVAFRLVSNKANLLCIGAKNRAAVVAFIIYAAKNGWDSTMSAARSELVDG